MKNKILLIAPILLTAMASWAHDGYHGGLLFTANLDGGQEVPAVSTGAKGLIGCKLNPTRDTIFITGSMVGLKSAITKLRIHIGKKGVAGPMTMDLSAKVKGNSISTAWTGFSRADVLSLLKGAYYINVHTAAFPDGELRGQLELEKDRLFTIELRGESEVPSIASPARGAAVLKLSPDNAVLTVDAVFQSLQGGITAVHLHKGAPGTNGDKAIDLTDSLIMGNGGVGGAVKATRTKVRLSSIANAAAFLDSLKKGSVYMNVHTSAFANGELRGYVNPDTERVFIANLSGSNEVPPLAGQGVGLGFFRLSANDSLLTMVGVFQGSGNPVTKLHMHAGTTGVAGAVVADLSAFISGNAVSTTVRIFSLPDPGAFLDSLVKGSLYFNVHTGPAAVGEMRGQLLLPARLGYVFRLEGAQENPQVQSKAFGIGSATMDHDGTNLRFSLAADSLGSAFKASHIHDGAAGTNGSVILDFTPAFANSGAHGIWSASDASPFTSGMAADFEAGKLYMNLHTLNNASGEIRGQIADVKPWETLTPILADMPDSWSIQPKILMSPGGLKIKAADGSSRFLDLRVFDLKGHLEAERILSVGKDGLSQSFNVSRLGRGVHIGIWQEGKLAYRLPFRIR